MAIETVTKVAVDRGSIAVEFRLGDSEACIGRSGEGIGYGGEDRCWEGSGDGGGSGHRRMENGGKEPVGGCAGVSSLLVLEKGLEKH